MIIPDANLLLYAYDGSNPFHDEAARWWSVCLSGVESVGLSDLVVGAFVRIGTSRAAFRNPMTVAEAARHVRAWLDRPNAQFVPMVESDLQVAFSLLERSAAGASLTTDAFIAAMALRLDATVHTADTDFQRFPNLRWVNPL